MIENNQVVNLIPFKIIVTHGPYCPDGKYSELCARYYYSMNPYDNLIYWQVDPGQQLENMKDLFTNLRDTIKVMTQKVGHMTSESVTRPMVEIISFDVGFNPETIITLLKTNSDMNITFDIYDHHISSINAWKEFQPNQTDKLEKLYKYTGNIDDCGATLAWKYYFNDKIPLILEYVRIRDNWLFDTQRAKDLNASEVNEYLNTFDVLVEPTKYFNLFSITEEKDSQWLNPAITFGKTMINNKTKEMKNIMKGGRCQILNGKNVFIVNSSIYQSDIGNEAMNQRVDYAIIWRFDEYTKKFHISLRSRKNGNIDVSKIAQRYGGGGHHSAAGLELTSFEEIYKLTV